MKMKNKKIFLIFLFLLIIKSISAIDYPINQTMIPYNNTLNVSLVTEDLNTEIRLRYSNFTNGTDLIFFNGTTEENLIIDININQSFNNKTEYIYLDKYFYYYNHTNSSNVTIDYIYNSTKNISFNFTYYNNTPFNTTGLNVTVLSINTTRDTRVIEIPYVLLYNQPYHNQYDEIIKAPAGTNLSVNYTEWLSGIDNFTILSDGYYIMKINLNIPANTFKGEYPNIVSITKDNITKEIKYLIKIVEATVNDLSLETYMKDIDKNDPEAVAMALAQYLTAYQRAMELLKMNQTEYNSEYILDEESNLFIEEIPVIRVTDDLTEKITKAFDFGNKLTTFEDKFISYMKERESIDSVKDNLVLQSAEDYLNIKEENLNLKNVLLETQQEKLNINNELFIENEYKKRLKYIGIIIMFIILYMLINYVYMRISFSNQSFISQLINRGSHNNKPKRREYKLK
jgi:hypothetical protein